MGILSSLLACPTGIQLTAAHATLSNRSTKKRGEGMPTVALCRIPLEEDGLVWTKPDASVDRIVNIFPRCVYCGWQS